MSALFRGQREDGSGRVTKPAKAAPSEEGNVDHVTHEFQRLLNQPSSKVSDDSCREAVARLNRLRLSRVENLGDGYEVSFILCYVFSATLTLPTQLLEELVFAPTIKDALAKYTEAMMSALLCHCGIFLNLTRFAARYAESKKILQRALGKKLKMP